MKYMDLSFKVKLPGNSWYLKISIHFLLTSRPKVAYLTGIYGYQLTTISSQGVAYHILFHEVASMSRGSVNVKLI